MEDSYRKMITAPLTIVYAIRVPIDRNSTSVSISNNNAIIAVVEPNTITAYVGTWKQYLDTNKYCILVFLDEYMPKI